MVGALAVLAGCPGPAPPPGVDAGDVDAPPGQPDADPGAGGLTFRFVANPLLPTPKDGAFEVIITEARYQLSEVRAIGDAAPGDARTSRAEFEIQFDGGAIDLPFPDAPQGIYSFLLAEVDRYTVKGELTKNDESMDFEIDDDGGGVNLEVDLRGEELGTDPVICVIRMDLRKITREVDWAPLQPEDGEEEIEISSDYANIDQLRDKADDFTKQ